MCSVNRGIVALVLSVVIGGVVVGAEGEAPSCFESLAERTSLTNSFFGLGTTLEEMGISPSLSMAQIYQRNVRGGLDSGYGHYSMTYDVQLKLDLEKILTLDGGIIMIRGRGGYDDGIDGRAVGSLFGVNGRAGGDRSLDIREYWYQQSWFDQDIILRIGKMDLTGGFDCCGSKVAFNCNTYACSTSRDFLNGAFGASAGIPFPGKGLGAALYVSPIEKCYFAAAVADAEADTREIGVSTTFDGDNAFFWVAEAGYVSAVPSANGDLPGAYRFGIWYDHQRKMYLDGSRSINGDVGYYFSGDQMVWRENSDPGNKQGLSVFGRINWADEDVNNVKLFWSCGGQYRGLLPDRDNDVLGVSYAHGRVGRDAGYRSSYEGVAEVYYNIEVMPWLHISPDVQWIMNPGADKTVDNAVVIGLRAQMDI